MTASHPLPRRRVLGGLVATLLAVPPALGACGSDDEPADGGVELSFFWWGGEARAQLTEQALALYTRRHPNVTFKKTWQANQGYFDKLATLTAGDDAPDIFQIDDNYLAEYATRNVTADLAEYQRSGALDVSRFQKGLVEYSTVDGKVAGVAMGENTQGLVFNRSRLTAAGVEPPRTGQTWQEHIAWARQAAAKTRVAGTMDPSADYKAFWVWLRQRGKEFYDGDRLGFTEADVQAWFELWQDARDSRSTPSPDVIHEGNATDVTKQLVVTGKALTSWVWANQLPELQKNTKDDLAVIAYPGDASKQWARASMYFSVYRGSKHKDVAVDVLDFLVNDPEAGKILGTDRGLPSNLDIRSQVAASTDDESMKATIKVMDELGKNFGPAPTVPPKGHSKVRSELVKAAEQAQFGRATPAQAAEQFFAAGQAAIKR